MFVFPSRTLPVLLIVAAVAGCVTRSTGFEPVEIDGWADAGAVRNSAGEWGCYASAPYRSGITLEIWRTGDGYRIDFEKPEWALEKGAVYPVTLSVDDLWRAQLDAVVDKEGIRVPLALDAKALSALRRGSILTMVARTEVFRFELQHEALTLDRLEACYRRHLPKSAAGYRNPFAQAQNPFKARPRNNFTSDLPVVMTSADLEQIFYKATGMEFRVEQPSGFTPSVDLVYFLDDDLYGQYWEQSIEGRSLDSVFALTLAGMQTDCAGRAVSGSFPGRQNNLAELRHGFVSCEEDDFFADILILANDSFVMTFVTSSSLDEAELAEQVGAAVGGSIVP